ncbi:GNAT family N-acetyltransferase [Paraburkholderia ferrariae]|uniref:GNAT family N-acetyltransferase n=1 Tax=Paraburkholderia ferrariae TaxID=386056 RepID=UPI000A05AD16|nr:GNAT family protein [Paraburkholderia ferrariae]
MSTPAVKLRPLEATDLGLLVTWRNDADNRGFFFSHAPLTHSGQSRWYESYLGKRDAILFVVCTAEGTPVGTVGLDNIDHKNQKAEFGRLLIGEPQFRQKGYGMIALRETLRYGFDELNLNRIYLQVFRDNSAAISLYKKVGFVDEGTLRSDHYSRGAWRDVLNMGLLRDEWEQTR